MLALRVLALRVVRDNDWWNDFRQERAGRAAAGRFRSLWITRGEELHVGRVPGVAGRRPNLRPPEELHLPLERTCGRKFDRRGVSVRAVAPVSCEKVGPAA